MAGRADYLQLGDWNALCSMCGRKRKASTMVRNWQGQWRCVEHNEARNAQDFVRAVPDVQTPPWTQPPTNGTYVQPTFNISTSGDYDVIQETGVTWATTPTVIVNIYPPVGGGITTVPVLTIDPNLPAGTVVVINNYGNIVSSVINVGGFSLEIHNWNGGITTISGYTLTAAVATIGPLTYCGFSDSEFGAMSPDTLDGIDIVGFATIIAGGTGTVFTLDATLVQAFFTSITVNSFTLTSAAASFLSFGGQSLWSWADVAIPSAAIYPVTII